MELRVKKQHNLKMSSANFSGYSTKNSSLFCSFSLHFMGLYERIYLKHMESGNLYHPYQLWHKISHHVQGLH